MTISIHASAKEATKIEKALLNDVSNFNPRLREGGDKYVKGLVLKKKHFNPRLREGGDRSFKIRLRE